MPKRVFTASSTRSASGMTSTPMPSPGMTAIRYFFDMLCSSIRACTDPITVILFLLFGHKMVALVKPLCTIRVQSGTPQSLIEKPMNAVPSPDLGDLRVFCEVARKASFSAAAESLSVSAAYVSKRINVLETTLGTRLLHRSTRRVAITEAGERVYTWAEKILDDVDQLVEDVSTTRRIPGGKLRISSSFGFGRRFVAPALARFSERYPQLSVR